MFRICRRRCALAITLAALAGSLSFWHAPPATAQWEWTERCFKKADLDVLQPLIQHLLREARPGTSVPWCSTTGREGHVFLVEGGEQAGKTTATIRITIKHAKHEQDWFVFRYRHDPARGWGIVG